MYSNKKRVCVCVCVCVCLTARTTDIIILQNKSTVEEKMRDTGRFKFKRTREYVHLIRWKLICGFQPFSFEGRLKG